MQCTTNTQTTSELQFKVRLPLETYPSGFCCLTRSTIGACLCWSCSFAGSVQWGLPGGKEERSLRSAGKAIGVGIETVWTVTLCTDCTSAFFIIKMTQGVTVHGLLYCPLRLYGMYSLAWADFHKTNESITAVTCRPLIPNFIQNCQWMWKGQTEIYVMK